MDRNTRRTALLALPLLVLASFIVYGRTLGYTAFSDDHSALWNTGVHGIPWRNGFFRPLSDLGFRIGFLVHGSDPFHHRIFNVLLHGINGYVLFRLVWDRRMELLFPATLGALLFICYPYHLESVIWLVGRESALGTFTVLAGLYLLCRTTYGARPWFAGALLFLGLLCYESALLLPLMALPTMAASERRRAAIALGTALIAHVVVRTLVVGWSGGSYLGSVIGEPGEILLNIPKVALRMFLPPNPDPRTLLLQALGPLALIVALTLWRTRSRKPWSSGVPWAWWWWFGMASVLPILAAVSTRTSESDRFLYMPSAFLCAGIGLLLSRIPQRPVRLGISAIVLLVALIQLRLGQANWQFASMQTRRILNELPRVDSGSRAFLLDLPDSYQGAFIFRNGSTEAIHLAHADGTRYIATDPAHIHTNGEFFVRFRGKDLPIRAQDSWYRWTGSTFQGIEGPDQGFE